MWNSPGLVRFAGSVGVVACCLLLAGLAPAQNVAEEFPTGKAAAAWSVWQPAMQAILLREPEKAEALFGELLAQDPSAFRVALLADRTAAQSNLGGAVLLLEQDYEAQSLGPNGSKAAELLLDGREQMNEADDGWYFSTIGRFDVAQANWRTLLDSEPDPVALVEFTDRVQRRRQILVQLVDNQVVGAAARDMLQVLDRGEELIKADPARIKTRIERLAGPPRAFENSVALLRESGEYAIPLIVQVLRDPQAQQLTHPILRFLPQVNRFALNPLVYALRTPEPLVQRYLVEALGELGYSQALPYLLQLYAGEQTAPEVREAITQAVASIAQKSGVEPNVTPAEAFYRLADAYYAEASSLMPDVRLDTANVWYWRDGVLQNLAVPRPIFNEIMAMRCCEEALRFEPNLQVAQALWIAANFRRAAQLPTDSQDPTRPPNNPSPLYFAQTAGPDVCRLALARAIDDRDAVVALGAIAALRNTAGPASLTTDASGRLPLAEALSFPDRLVRIRAALTLANARPTAAFANYQNLMPVLAEALLLHGGARSALIIDPDDASANAVAAALRENGYQAVTDAEFARGLQKARDELPALDLVFLASDLQDVPLADALAQLRAEFRFAAAPVILVAKPGDREMVRDFVRADHRLGQVLPGEPADRILAAVEQVSRAVGATTITPELGTEIALETAEVLRLLGLTRNPLYDPAAAKAGLLVALDTPAAELKTAVARVLAYVPDREAQEAVAGLALDESAPEELRVEMFAILAEAGKLCGSQLGDQTITRLVDLAEAAENLTIRTAASQAMGALNLPARQGSEIIRNQYNG